MDELRKYLISIVLSVLISSVLLSCAKNTSYHKLMQLICGLFLSVTLIQPIGNLPVNSNRITWDSIKRDAEDLTRMAGDRSDASLAAIIKEETEAYILDKAQPYCDEIWIEVILTDGNLPIPQKVYITADTSIYGKYRIAQILTEDLGITKENQIWTEP